MRIITNNNMQWLINFAFLALDCSLPIVHALISSLPLLTNLDVQIGEIEVFMARELDKKYRWIPPEQIVLDPHCIHLDPQRIAWICNRSTNHFFFRKHLGRTAITSEDENGHYLSHTFNDTPGFYPWDRRVALRRGYWRSQIKSELELFCEI